MSTQYEGPVINHPQHRIPRSKDPTSGEDFRNISVRDFLILAVFSPFLYRHGGLMLVILITTAYLLWPFKDEERALKKI